MVSLLRSTSFGIAATVGPDAAARQFIVLVRLFQGGLALVQNLVEGGEIRLVHRLPTAIRHSLLELKRAVAPSRDVNVGEVVPKP